LYPARILRNWRPFFANILTYSEDTISARKAEMVDAISLFEDARKDDRVVSKDDVHTKLLDLTVDDWRSIAKTYDRNSELVHNFYVEEKPNAFVVHNDPDALKDARITGGAWGLVRGAGLTGIGLGLGHLAMRLTPYGRVGGTVLGALTGFLMHRSDANHIDNLEQTSYPLNIAKSGLKLE
jgi:hypothetical protein